MGEEASGDSGTNWRITKFIVAITALITAIVTLVGLVPEPFDPFFGSDQGPLITPSSEEPTVQERVATRISPESMKIEIVHLQEEALNALKAGRLAEADSKLQQAEDLIDDALSQWPADIDFLNLRGYHHKNFAIEYQRLSMDEKADEHLDIAEKSFRLILSLDEEDAGAWNGLGSVYILRCELDQAEEYIRIALDINPEYGPARRDLDRIPAFREACNR
jgi:tetratricopeptide (TPR) repeat protein